MSDQRRAAVMLALTVVGTAAMGVGVWVTTPPASSARPVAANRIATSPVAAARPATAVATQTVPACTPAPLAERAGRTLLVGLPGVTDPDAPLVREVLDLGVGGVFLNTDNVRSRDQVTRLVQGIRERAGRPILVATDEESGRVSVFRELVGAGPSPRRMAAQETPAATRQQARRMATELTAMGIDLDLAPVADLDDGPSTGIIGDRSFSGDPTVASTYAQAFAAGLVDGGVLPVAKHFPGQGRSTADIHVKAASVTVTLGALQDTDLRPFDALIHAGIPVVMMNHVRYSSIDPTLPASLSPRAYQLLRGLGFQGAAITDSVGMGAINLTWDTSEATVKAITAGADGVLNTGGETAKNMRQGLLDAVHEGRLDESRLNEAAARMVALAGADPDPVTCLSIAGPQAGDLGPRLAAQAAPGEPQGQG